MQLVYFVAILIQADLDTALWTVLRTTLRLWQCTVNFFYGIVLFLCVQNKGFILVKTPLLFSVLGMTLCCRVVVWEMVC